MTFILSWVTQINVRCAVAHSSFAVGQRSLLFLSRHVNTSDSSNRHSFKQSGRVSFCSRLLPFCKSSLPFWLPLHSFTGASLLAIYTWLCGRDKWRPTCLLDHSQVWAVPVMVTSKQDHNGLESHLLSWNNPSKSQIQKSPFFRGIPGRFFGSRKMICLSHTIRTHKHSHKLLSTLSVLPSTKNLKPFFWKKDGEGPMPKFSIFAKHYFWRFVCAHPSTDFHQMQACDPRYSIILHFEFPPPFVHKFEKSRPDFFDILPSFAHGLSL